MSPPRKAPTREPHPYTWAFGNGTSAEGAPRPGRISTKAGEQLRHDRRMPRRMCKSDAIRVIGTGNRNREKEQKRRKWENSNFFQPKSSVHFTLSRPSQRMVTRCGGSGGPRTDGHSLPFSRFFLRLSAGTIAVFPGSPVPGRMLLPMINHTDAAFRRENLKNPPEKQCRTPTGAGSILLSLAQMVR